MKPAVQCLAFFLSGLVVGVGVDFAFFPEHGRALLGRKLSHSSASSTLPPQESGAQARKPWGELIYTPFYLTLPDEFFPQLPPVSGSLQWFMNEENPVALKSLIHSWLLTEAEKAVLLDTNRWTATNHGHFITIPPPLALDLSPAARQQVYSVLAASEHNVGYRYPFRFEINGFDKWFEGSALPPEKIRLVKSLTYTNDGTICFSDLNTLKHLFSPEQMRQLLKTLYETPTFIMKLQVKPDSDLEALVRYWGAHDRARAIQPFLESLAKVPEGSEMSVSFLLPPLPRILLYTFPNPFQDNSTLRQDCIWTSLNFFNEKPDHRFLDGQHAEQVLRNDYTPRTDIPQFGDLVAFYDTNGSMRHLCVYIADEVVFTKNGVGQLQPWVFMKLPDLKLKYGSLGSFRLALLRSKSSLPEAAR